MFCTFCKKSASKLATHLLCGICSVHVGCNEATAINGFGDPSPKTIKKGDCEMCLRKYPEDELEEHRQKCTVRMVFQCIVCDETYMSKAGLWDHLDRHEIAVANKESHCRKTRTTYKLQTCELCNDQRGYREKLYWRHIHEDHDAFFLQCSTCGAKFRSQKSQNDHILNLCNVGGDEKSHENEKNCTISDGENSTNDYFGIKCTQCDKYFRNKAYLAGHVNKCHQEYVCNNCGETVYGARKFSTHMLRHTSPKHKCPYCHKMFHWKFNLERHLSKHTRVKERKVPCELCGVKFASLTNLDMHKKRYHQVKKIPANRSSRIQKHLAKALDKETHHPAVNYRCGQCNQIFDRKISFEEHLDEHQKNAIFKCELCDHRCEDQTTFQSHMLSIHNTAMNSDGFQCTCPICGIIVPSVQLYQYHKLHFHTEPKFHCEHCPRKFFTKSSYKSHVVSHERKHIFACTFCNVRYKRLCMLQAHMKRRHSGKLKDADQSGQFTIINSQDLDEANTMGACYDAEEKIEIKEEIQVEETSIAPSSLPTEKCPQCHQLFSDSFALQEHQAVFHQSNRCVICNIDFYNQIRLRYHKLISHTEPRYECVQCGKKFHIKGVHARHELTHQKAFNRLLKPIVRTRVRSKFAAPKTRATDQSTGLQCSHCPSRFLTEERLQRHVDYTHSKKEVQCTLCDLTFPSQYKMYYHRKITHTEPKHECPYCEKKYYVKYRLQEHLAVHVTSQSNCKRKKKPLQKK